MKMHSRRCRYTSLLVPFLLAVLSVQAFSQSGYHLIKQIKLGGDGGWDILTFDAKAHRLYISRSTHVMVVDVDSGAVVGDIPNTQIGIKLGGDGGWDILTFDAKAHRLYISRSTHVMVVDVDSGAVVGDIPNT